MALSEADIDKAVEAVLHGAEERYAGELADITAELAKRAAEGGWDASELAQLAAEFEQRASEVTAAYSPSIRSEAREAVADAVSESALAELAMLAALTAAHNAAKGTRKAAAAAVAAAAGDNAPKLDEAAQRAAEKRVRAIADYAAKGVSDALARQNLSMTATAARAWREAAQRAALDSLAGNLPQDAAIERAYRELGGSFRVQHASGRRDSVDVALRRMMATELSQASGRATLANLDAAGWQLAHTDAHYGARPRHAEWQGRPFGVNGPVVVDGVEYPGMAELTGYGTATGLKGVNCRHTIEVYVPGETEPPDTEFKEDSALHNGMTSEEYYEAVQRQRALERAVRGTRYQVAMMEKMGMGLEHPSYVQKRLELGNRQAKLAKHCKANNLTRIPSRERAYGIGKQPRGLRRQQDAFTASSIRTRSGFARSSWSFQREYGALYSKRGQLVGDVLEGRAGAVTFRLPKGESWENVRPVRTHNGTFGGTFSVGGNGSGDIYHLTKANTLGYDAICNEGRYTIDRTEKSRPEEFYEAAKAAEIGAREKAIDAVGDEWLKSGKSIMNGSAWEELEEDERKAASDAMDKWLKENAGKFGYRYRFTRRKGS